MSEKVSTDIRPFVCLLASGSDDKLPFDSATSARRLHGMRVLPLGQHFVLREATKAAVRKKQLV